MFTNTKAGYVRDGKVLTESACLSTDTKPTTGIANGSVLIEMDTGDTYAFDETGAGTWRKLSSSGGGGSSLPAVTSDDNGDVLTVVNGAWDKASPSGGGGNFVVNFEVDFDGDTPTATADKTYSQISTAHSSGQNVVGYWDDGNVVWEIPFLCISDEEVVFIVVYATSAGGAIAGFTSYEFHISSSDVVTFTDGAYDF